jgi:DNA invertase Pin-like site-specific DNA recombinase
VEYVTDAGFSGKNMKRPALIDALARLRAGEAQMLCVSRMDRLSRSLMDFTSLMADAQRQGWVLHALDSPADLTTPSGEAMASVLMVFSQLERRLIGERTKAALAAKKAEGVTLGRPRAIGEDVARMAAGLRAEGLSLRKIGAALSDAGHTPPNGRAWHAETVKLLLQRDAVPA